jgi:hypothetical protein
MKKTHDGLDVYPVGSKLPWTAKGWTQCRLFDGACLTWIDEKDIDTYKEHLNKIDEALKLITTKKGGIAAMKGLGLSLIGCDKLKDMKLRIRNNIVERSWPLIEVDDAVSASN